MSFGFMMLRGDGRAPMGELLNERGKPCKNREQAIDAIHRLAAKTKDVRQIDLRAYKYIAGVQYFDVLPDGQQYSFSPPADGGPG